MNESVKVTKSRLLVVNVGSSSIKAALFDNGAELHQVWSGSLPLKGAGAGSASTEGLFVEWLERRINLQEVAVVGHRVVNGGQALWEPVWVEDSVLEKLQSLQTLDPDHAPLETSLINSLRKQFPGLPQVLCFDTAFHRNMPQVASALPIPRRYGALGLRRYGFHGLSYTYLTEELARIGESNRQVVLCHLGNGASLAAVRDGVCIDTTMGFTPTSGIMMSTRSGDLDPGVLFFLTRTQGMDCDQLDHMVNKEAGLLGISETSADMQELLISQHADARAAEATAMFCYQVQKNIGALAAVLGGLDTLVFSGGIGEHSAEVRTRSTEGLAFLGIDLDETRNTSSSPVISSDRSRVTVRVIPTNEELVIARAARDLVLLRQSIFLSTEKP